MKLIKVDLYRMANFLSSIDMNARMARARNRLVENILEKAKQYLDEQKEIVTAMGGTIHSDGTITYSEDPEEQAKKVEEVGHELQELANETVDISKNYEEQFDNLKDFFSKWDGMVEAKYNIAYETLMNYFEL